MKRIISFKSFRNIAFVGATALFVPSFLRSSTFNSMQNSFNEKCMTIVDNNPQNSTYIMQAVSMVANTIKPYSPMAYSAKEYISNNAKSFFESAYNYTSSNAKSLLESAYDYYNSFDAKSFGESTYKTIQRIATDNLGRPTNKGLARLAKSGWISESYDPYAEAYKREDPLYQIYARDSIDNATGFFYLFAASAVILTITATYIYSKTRRSKSDKSSKATKQDQAPKQVLESDKSSKTTKQGQALDQILEKSLKQALEQTLEQAIEQALDQALEQTLEQVMENEPAQELHGNQSEDLTQDLDSKTYNHLDISNDMLSDQDEQYFSCEEEFPTQDKVMTENSKNTVNAPGITYRELPNSTIHSTCAQRASMHHTKDGNLDAGYRSA